MNIYHALNQVISYIEDNLENEIEYKKLAHMIGIDEYTLQRIFSLLCNISISEYIRNRRLSVAGLELCQTNLRIIDIALKYQYENPTSFSRAFEKFHHIKPSQAQKNPEKLIFFPKIFLNEALIENANMEYSIIFQEDLTFYGISTQSTIQTIAQDAPKFFQKVSSQYSNTYGEIHFAMTNYENYFFGNRLEYCILYDHEIKELTPYHIPKSRWLCFHIPSQEAIDIQKLVKQFYVSFLPNCPYHLKGLPELEHYHDNVTDFLVAIQD